MQEPTAWSRFQQVYDGLAREPNSERLCRRFVKVLQTVFELPSATVFSWSQQSGLEALDLSRSPGMEPQLQLVFSEAFTAGELFRSEYRDGLHDCWLTTRTGQSSVKFLHFTTSNGLRVVAFKDPDEGSEELVLTCKVVQQFSKWMRRHNRDQARLQQDGLTGLYNFRHLENSIESEIRRGQRFDDQFCLLFLDLDNFKSINDQHGHLIGSRLLKGVADLLRREVREVDLVFRYGGDEFVILLVAASLGTGMEIAERIRLRLAENHFSLKSPLESSSGPAPYVQITITSSIGVANYPTHGTTKTSLLAFADRCMYRSKHLGKNRVNTLDRSEIGALETT